MRASCCTGALATNLDGLEVAGEARELRGFRAGQRVGAIGVQVGHTIAYLKKSAMLRLDATQTGFAGRQLQIAGDSFGLPLSYLHVGCALAASVAVGNDQHMVRQSKQCSIPRAQGACLTSCTQSVDPGEGTLDDQCTSIDPKVLAASQVSKPLAAGHQHNR